MTGTAFSYQRLRNEAPKEFQETKINELKARSRWSVRLRLKKVHIRKRLKTKIPSLRRKARVVMASVAKVLKRLKESRSHFGDLFAGNYLFLHVNPTPFKSSSL